MSRIMMPATESDLPDVRSSRVVAAVLIGNAIEFFDFIVYSQFALYIGRAYFSSANATASLLLSVAVFGAGFLFRPVGGIVIGAYADRAGRRPALILTISLITVGTLGIAITPSFDQIGMAAPVIVVSARLLQGFALGGDIGPVTAYLFEAAPLRQQAIFLSWQSVSQALAGLIAGSLGLLLSSYLPANKLQQWGWRIPFVFCVFLIPIALHLRRTMPETIGLRSRDKRTPRFATTPAGSRKIFHAISLLSGFTIASYFGLYVATYAVATLHLSASTAFEAVIIHGVAAIAGALSGGYLADRYGRKPVMLTPAIIFCCTLVPSFYWLSAIPTAATLFLIQGFLTFTLALSAPVSLLTIAAIMPRWARASALGFAYSTSISIFGGTAQFVFTALIDLTSNRIAPAWYVMIFSLVTTVSSRYGCFQKQRIARRLIRTVHFRIFIFKGVGEDERPDAPPRRKRAAAAAFSATIHSV